jgi:hypothetical protein
LGFGAPLGGAIAGMPSEVACIGMIGAGACGGGAAAIVGSAAAIGPPGLPRIVMLGCGRATSRTCGAFAIICARCGAIAA